MGTVDPTRYDPPPAGLLIEAVGASAAAAKPGEPTMRKPPTKTTKAAQDRIKPSSTNI